MTIKLALPENAAPIAKLILLAIDDIANQLTGEMEESNVLKQLEAFITTDGNRFSCDCILVKEINNEPVGMILCYHGSHAAQLYTPVIDHLIKKSGDPSITIDDEADIDEYYIDAIAVSPSFQGQGIAKQLIAAAELRAIDMGYDKIALNVDQTNEGAHALYVKLGYKADKEITIHDKPYWHMVKFLS
ncbi:GNAT family N-acetyltransferase [Cohnella sp. WQ 127256]|uniref:GNAT family N-acetyltransferase n=1 Tax=Cohnella sp. WQ 127256 TaxID=2938790 RepID=UPI002118E8E4|nr:GNAT family N-acetyltransferase [Cohnella sp. WQ 127256]